MGSIADATATEKRLVRKLYQKLNDRDGRWGAADADSSLRRNDRWFAGNKNGRLETSHRIYAGYRLSHLGGIDRR